MVMGGEIYLYQKNGKYFIAKIEKMRTEYVLSLQDFMNDFNSNLSNNRYNITLKKI